MRQIRPISSVLIALIASCIVHCGASARAAALHPLRPIEEFVSVNGVHLQVLDWGGSGPPLILVHGLADNAHVFDDIAPAFVSRFHVIAYGSRGADGSDAIGPYDVGMMTEDLVGLMDALRLPKASLVGYSAGADEITEMAAKHPERVEKLVYFEGGYDWTDPKFKQATASTPLDFFTPPADALRSLAAFRDYKKEFFYPSLNDLGRIDGNIRAKIFINQNGTVAIRMKKAVSDELVDAFFSNPVRRYSDVHCPSLAIYAQLQYDPNIKDTKKAEALSEYEQEYWIPFRARSIDHIKRELKGVRIVQVAGAHGSFFMTDRARVVEAMMDFLVDQHRR